MSTYDPVKLDITGMSDVDVAKWLNHIALITPYVSSRYYICPERGNKQFVVAELSKGGYVWLVKEQVCRDSNGDAEVTAGSWSAETVAHFLSLEDAI